MLKENESQAEQGAPAEGKNDRERRKSLGIYYTPPEAAKILAAWVIRHPDEVVLEPSFGGCAMLSAAVSVFRSLGNASPSAQLYGYDVDGAAFGHLSRMGISNDAGQFRKADFLRSDAGALKVDAVLANPPFVSHHRQSLSQRRLTEKMRAKYFVQLPKFASLWAFFLLHSLTFLRPGGRMAFVLPNAIGTADYGRALLSHLSHRFSKVELVHISERLFIQAGADERISLLLLSDYAPHGLPTPSEIVTKDVPRVSDLATITQANEPNGWETQFCDPRMESVALITKHARSALVELGTIASVHIGEVIGDIPFFVKTKQAWSPYRIAPKHLVPLLTRAAQSSGLFLTEEMIESGSARTPYLLLPPNGKLPKPIEHYLAGYAVADVAENKTFQKRQNWYRCSYDSTSHAFIGSMNHDWPRIIGNSAGISCSNSFYKIRVLEKAEFVSWLPIISLTTPFRLSAEILGRVRGSGGVKLEPSDVCKLYVPCRVPKLSSSEFSRVRDRVHDLVCRGELDAAGQLADSIIYLKPRLVSSEELFELRKKRLELTNRRLIKIKSV